MNDINDFEAKYPFSAKLSRLFIREHHEKLAKWLIEFIGEPGLSWRVNSKSSDEEYLVFGFEKTAHHTLFVLTWC